MVKFAIYALRLCERVNETLLLNTVVRKMPNGIFDEYSKICVRKREEKRKSPRLYTENPTLLLNSNAHNRKNSGIVRNGVESSSKRFRVYLPPPTLVNGESD